MKVLIFLCFLSVISADDDEGRYVHDNSGKYIPTDEGQYIPDYSGQYVHDGLGNYRDDGTGRFSGRFRNSFNGFGNNLLTSSTKARAVIQPVAPIEPKIIPTTTSAPLPRQPIQTYENQKEGKWRIIKKLEDVDADGYHWEYETENKIVAEESGKVHNVGTDGETMRAKGFYQYTGPDNVVYSVQYTADENGFNAIGNHLPTPPPLPAELAKALELERANNKL